MAANPVAKPIRGTGIELELTTNQTTLHLSLVTIDIEADRSTYRITNTFRTQGSVDTIPGHTVDYDWFSDVIISGTGLFDPNVADGPSFNFPTRDQNAVLSITWPPVEGETNGAVWTTAGGAFTRWNVTAALESIGMIAFEYECSQGISITQGS